MTTLDLTITFHGPFRVATGSASRGLDAVVDRERIPATSVKGVMRASAREILGLGDGVIERIFGGPDASSPWGWTDILLPDDDRVTVRSRVRIPIDPSTGVAAAGSLFHAEEVWVTEPLRCGIELIGRSDDPRGDALLLAASAMAVKGFGASRRRGLGWITITPEFEGRTVPPRQAARAVIEARGAG